MFCLICICYICASLCTQSLCVSLPVPVRHPESLCVAARLHVSLRVSVFMRASARCWDSLSQISYSYHKVKWRASLLAAPAACTTWKRPASLRPGSSATKRQSRPCSVARGAQQWQLSSASYACQGRGGSVVFCVVMHRAWA